jgi:hypothetical protein
MSRFVRVSGPGSPESPPETRDPKPETIRTTRPFGQQALESGNILPCVTELFLIRYLQSTGHH